jgi:hypothetical protein
MENCQRVEPHRPGALGSKWFDIPPALVAGLASLSWISPGLTHAADPGVPPLGHKHPGSKTVLSHGGMP